MRRLVTAALVVALLPLAGCASSARGPAQPIAIEQVAPVFGLDVAAVRGTILRFLDAYAGASTDDGLALSEVVAGRKLTAWVQWLGVQNREFDGQIRGVVDLRSVRFLALLPVEGGLGAQVDLSASVGFTFTPSGGEPFDRTRVLDGPVTLVRLETADWQVVDVTRDGISMDGSIQLFEHLERSRRGIEVRLDSLFAFTPNWQFNVVVSNHSSTPIELTPAGRVSLFVEGPGGVDRIDGAVTDSLLRVPAGATVRGLCAFPLQPSGQGRIVSFVYDPGAARSVHFDFSLNGLVSETGAPPTTASGDPDASS